MRICVLRLLLPYRTISRRLLHTSGNAYVQQEKMPSSDKVDDDPPEFEENVFKGIRAGARELKRQFKLLWEEVGSLIIQPSPIISNDVCVTWKFDKDEKCLEQWKVSCDRDSGLGNSTAKLEQSHSGTGIFSGVLDTTVPKDGKITSTGYCNMTSIQETKFLWKKKPLNWHSYNTLVLRVRGDGRSYMLNLLCPDTFDVTWHDMYHYVLYTRGGPYWQIVQIPFSKFVFASKGVVQDAQRPIYIPGVKALGITVADKINGPFRLEIDYIGVKYNSAHTETFAYELYHTTSRYL